MVRYNNPYDPRYQSIYGLNPSLDNTQNESPGFFQSGLDGLQSGFGGATGNIGWFMESKTGYGEDLGNWGNSLVQSNQRTKQWNDGSYKTLDYWTDPSGATYDFLNATGSSIPAIGGSLAAGLATEGLGAVPVFLAATGTNAVIDTGMEMGGVYKEARDMGHSDNRANELSNEAGLLNLPASLLAAAGDTLGARYIPGIGKYTKVGKASGSLANSLVPSGGKTAGAIKFGTTLIADAGTEYLQEGYQNSMERTVLDQNSYSDMLPWNWTQDDKYAAFVGALGSGGMVTVGAGVNSLLPSGEVSDNIVPQIDNSIYENIGNRYTLDDLNNIASNTIESPLEFNNDVLANDYQENFISPFNDDNISFEDKVNMQRDFINRNQEQLVDYDIFGMSDKVSLQNEDVLSSYLKDDDIINEYKEKYQNEKSQDGFLESVLDQVGTDEFLNDIIVNDTIKNRLKNTLDESGNYTNDTLNQLNRLSKSNRLDKYINNNRLENKLRKSELKDLDNWAVDSALNNGFERVSEISESRKTLKDEQKIIQEIESMETYNKLSSIKTKFDSMENKNEFVKQAYKELMNNKTESKIINYLKQVNSKLGYATNLNLNNNQKSALKKSKDMLYKILSDIDPKYSFYEANNKYVRSTKELGNKLGVKVQSFVGDNKVRGWYNSKNSSLMINEMTQDKAPAWIVGHEFFHHLKKNDEKIFFDLVSKVSLPYDEIEIYRKQLVEASGRHFNTVEATEEYVANALGEWMANEPAKLEQILNNTNDKNILQRILEAFKNWYRKLMEDNKYTDRKALYDSMPEILKEYMSENGNVKPDFNIDNFVNDYTSNNQPTINDKQSIKTKDNNKESFEEQIKTGRKLGDTNQIKISDENLKFDKQKRLAEILINNGWKHEKINNMNIYVRPDSKTYHNKIKEIGQTATQKEIDAKIDVMAARNIKEVLAIAKEKGYKKTGKTIANKAKMNFWSFAVDRFSKLTSALQGEDYVANNIIDKAVHTMGSINNASANIAGSIYNYGSYKSEYEMPNLGDGLGNKRVKGFVEIVSDIDRKLGKDHHNSPEFLNVIMSGMVLDSKAKNPNIKTPFTLEEANSIWNNAKPEEIQAAKEFSRLMHYMAFLLKENGILATDKYNLLIKTYPRYTPFFMMKDTDQLIESIDNFNSGRLLNPKNPIKFLRDNETNELINPLDAISSQITAYQFQIDSNTSIKLLTKTLRSKELINDYDGLWSPISEEKAKHITNKFHVWVNGKKQYYETSQGVANVLKSLTPYTTKEFVKWLSKPAKLIRWGTVNSPVFALNNFLNDQIPAMLTTGFAVNPIKVISKMKDVWKESDSFIEMAQAGGFQGSRATISEYSNPGGDHKSSLENKEFFDLLKSGNIFKMGKGIAKGFQRIAEVSENATRLAVYEVYRKDGMSPKEAALKVRQLTDFSAGGSNSFRQYTAIVPFMNPAIQGVRTIIEPLLFNSRNGELPISSPLRKFNIKNQKGAILFGMAAMAVLGTAIEASFGDDDDYKNIPDYMKAQNIVIPMKNGGYIRIPFGREIATVAYRTPQIIMEYAKTGNSNILKGHTKKMYDSITPPLIPSLVLLWAENETNYDFFRQRHIVPKSETSKPEVLQYGAYTSPSMIYIAKGLHNMGIEVSPRKIEHFFKTSASTVGSFTLGIIDEGLSQAGLAKDTPSKDILEMIPVINSYVKTRTGTETVQKASVIADDWKKDGQLSKEGLISKGSFDKTKYNKIKSLDGRLNQLFSEQSKIAKDINMDGDKKKIQLEKLQQRQRDIAEKIIQINGS